MERPAQYYLDRAAAILKRIQYVTVASVTADLQPWNSPVRAVFDQNLNCYWFSDKNGQHSQNVRHNGLVYLVVYDSTVPEGNGVGVYFEAEAEELSERAEIMRARRLKHEDEEADPDRFLGSAVRRVYRAIPKRAWTNEVQRSDGEFVRDYRVPLNLSALCRAMKLLL